MYSFQKAAATGENNTNVSGRIVTWNVCSPLSCHLQQKHYDYILSVTLWFFFFSSIWIPANVWLIQQQSAPTPSAPFRFSAGSEPRCGDTLSFLGCPGILYACVAHEWVCGSHLALSGMPDCTHIHRHAPSHTYRRVVNISWAAVYFTAFLKLNVEESINLG